jgi:acyl-coenzyme A synthetase/AMP-(fatty) acid ligase
MLFPSTRFATVAALDLIEKTDGKAILVPKTIVPSIAASVLQVRQMPRFEIPDVDELLDREYPAFAYDKTFDEARCEPLVMLHTSGSTGFPKPVLWTHDWANATGMGLYLAIPEGYESLSAKLLDTRVLSLFPQFHVRFLPLSSR